MWTVLVVVVAAAHPFGDQAAAHRLEAVIAADGVRGTWTLDVPAVLLFAGETDAARAFERMSAEVVAGLAVRTDGRAADVTFTPGEPTRSDEESWLFPVAFEVRWETLPAELRFEDGNLVDVTGYFRTDLAVAPGVAVTGSSLLPLGEDGRPALDRSGRWREGEQHRVVEVALAPRWAFAGEPRPLRVAFGDGSDGVSWRAVAVAVLGILAVLGLSRRRGGPSVRGG